MSSPRPALHDRPDAVPGLWRRFLPVWLAGLLGVASLLLQPLPAQLAQMPGPPSWPPPLLRLLLLSNPLVLVTLLALLGAAVAHRVGLASRLAGTRPAVPGPWVLRSLLWGLALGVALTVLDRLVAPQLGPAWQQVVQRHETVPMARALAIGALYGGLAEEVMLRWGVLSALAWMLARLFGQRPGVYGTAALLAALLFGAAHLPALALEVALTPAILLRTVALNTLAGFVYGLLFWRRGLEAAMVAHAGTHLALALLRSAG